ncbi:hypothetical protein [Aurantimonas sp. VKM B-3413]|uniref:hypothetical protein n=1 Tax=Aurantimonas sp. VKM B-3413 TaxID=2779401 RepID=UPI001E303644|nr:hypothetical protein [Aurantimonas sp. VKM B-3413]MCB8836004.1 hypothetical protein [Aurantimonas sp. VKM B-3413]
MPKAVTLPFGVLVEIIRVGLLRRTLKELLACLALVLFCLALAAGFDLLAETFDTGAEIFRENGPIELVQAFIVGIAGLLFYLVAIRFGFELFYGSLLLSLGCGLAVLREIPGCASRFYDGGVCLTAPGKDGLTVLLVAAVAILAAIRHVPFARHIRELNFFWVLPSGFAFAILILAEIMERLHSMGAEETLELAGYLVLLIFALTLNLKSEWYDARKKPELPETGFRLPAARR